MTFSGIDQKAFGLGSFVAAVKFRRGKENRNFKLSLLTLALCSSRSIGHQQ